jgi:hypothetical protein
MPDYQFGWFNELLCAKLDKFLDDVLAERSPRLMVFAPPRHPSPEVVLGSRIRATVVLRNPRCFQRLIDVASLAAHGPRDFRGSEPFLP